MKLYIFFCVNYSLKIMLLMSWVNYMFWGETFSFSRLFYILYCYMLFNYYVKPENSHHTRVCGKLKISFTNT
jgi:hypothetical protein